MSSGATFIAAFDGLCLWLRAIPRYVTWLVAVVAGILLATVSGKMTWLITFVTALLLLFAVASKVTKAIALIALATSTPTIAAITTGTGKVAGLPTLVACFGLTHDDNYVCFYGILDEFPFLFLAFALKYLK